MNKMYSKHRNTNETYNSLKLTENTIEKKEKNLKKMFIWTNWCFELVLSLKTLYTSLFLSVNWTSKIEKRIVILIENKAYKDDDKRRHRKEESQLLWLYINRMYKDSSKTESTTEKTVFFTEISRLLVFKANIKDNSIIYKTHEFLFNDTFVKILSRLNKVE
jgi:hypothetical protein